MCDEDWLESLEQYGTHNYLNFRVESSPVAEDGDVVMATISIR